MAPEILSVKDVAFQYKGSDWRLHPSSFEVKRGEILGIIGPNGSGKSTLLKVAAGILRPHGGEVLSEGQKIAEMPRKVVARRLGYLPQRTENGFEYTVEEVVAMGRFPHARGAGFLSMQDLAVVTRCLRLTETEQHRMRGLSRLSGGERQRVLLAAVLAQEPQVLLLDEPTSPLDIHHQARFFALLKEFVSAGTAVVVVTHDLNLASIYGDRLLLLADGEIVKQGTPEEILTETVLQATYGDGLEVVSHPTLRYPVVLPTRGSLDRRPGED